MIRRVLLGIAVALGAGVPFAAADEVVSGLVVKTDRREVYINLGEGKGVEDGASIRFKRPIDLRHPVSRKPVKDWLPLGDGTVTDTGQSMARVALDPGLLGQVKVGDLAEVYVVRAEQAPPAPPPPPRPVEPDLPMPQLDPETAQVLQVWRAVSGASLDARIAAWEGWLAAHAASPYADAIREDLEVLRTTGEAMTPAGTLVAPRRGLHMAHSAPSRADAGAPVALAFVLDQPAEVTAATLHARTVGQATFRRVELTREHGIYLRGALPAELAAAPGIQYFVEATRADGSASEAYASAAAPAQVTIAPPPLVSRFAPTKRRTKLTLLFSYLDFATLDRRTMDGMPADRTDRFALTEIDILYRLDGMLYGVRAGFGAYGGRGGFANAVWGNGNDAPIIGFQYGYAEAEMRMPVEGGPPLGLAGRFIAGVGRDGFGVGVAGRARVGDPDRTNLSVGLSTLDQVGFYSDLRLETWPSPQVPVGISVGVTDQPGGNDLGVRLATDVGYRARPWVTPTVRVSWQGRTAAHSGVGGGVGLVFDW